LLGLCAGADEDEPRGQIAAASDPAQLVPIPSMAGPSYVEGHSAGLPRMHNEREDVPFNCSNTTLVRDSAEHKFTLVPVFMVLSTSRSDLLAEATETATGDADVQPSARRFHKA
jgi:hypothetical protein